MHETVSHMIERGAKVRWFCEIGQGHSGDVDLKAVAKARGGNVTLVNRRPMCKIPGCPGRVYFTDLSSAWPRKLDTIPAHEAFDFYDREHRRLEALGYRMVQGYWRGPDTTKAAPDEPERPR